jgi:hypothetical protein
VLPYSKHLQRHIVFVLLLLLAAAGRATVHERLHVLLQLPLGAKLAQFETMLGDGLSLSQNGR